MPEEADAQTIPTNDVPDNPEVRQSNSGSPFDILLFIKKHFLNGNPPMFNVVTAYSRIRPSYAVTLSFKHVEIKFGNIVKWFLTHLCYLLDIIFYVIYVLIIFAVLLTLLFSLLKVVGLGAPIFHTLHLQ